MSVRSMTGFARVRRTADDGELAVSLKSVNHRGLDLHFQVPPEFDAAEPALRSLLKARLARGHVDVRVTQERVRRGAAFSIDEALLQAYVDAFRRAATAHGLESQPDLNAALRLPGMLAEVAAEGSAPAHPLLLDAAEEAVGALNSFREREGAELAAELRARNNAISAAAARLHEVRSRAVPLFQARLGERLGELLRGAHIDPQRLAQEVAFLTDRSDIGEEVTRLQIHSAQLAALLDAGGEIGKKLDFLSQELQREANTILSKTSGIGETGLAVTDAALAIKADIEKIRELALNLE